MNRRERWYQTVRIEAILLGGVMVVEILLIFLTRSGAEVLPPGWDINVIFKWTLVLIGVMAMLRIISGLFIGVYKRPERG